MKSPLDGKWTHEDEELLVDFKGQQIMLDSTYDHTAQPDYIDTVVRDE